MTLSFSYLVFNGDCVSYEALRIAVEHARLWFADVAIFDLDTAKRALCIGARGAAVDENESDPARESTRACVRRAGAHVGLYEFPANTICRWQELPVSRGFEIGDAIDGQKVIPESRCGLREISKILA